MDQIDCKILSALQADARRKNADIARDLGLAPSSTLERVRRLEERGLFKGFRAIIDPEELGLTVQALVSITLSQHSTETIKPFEEAVRAIPYVLACYHVTGRFDYFLHIVAKNLKHLGILVKDHLADIKGVGTTETFLVFSEIKSNQGFPLEKIL